MATPVEFGSRAEVHSSLVVHSPRAARKFRPVVDRGVLGRPSTPGLIALGLNEPHIDAQVTAKSRQVPAVLRDPSAGKSRLARPLLIGRAPGDDRHWLHASSLGKESQGELNE